MQRAWYLMLVVILLSFIIMATACDDSDENPTLTDGDTTPTDGDEENIPGENPVLTQCEGKCDPAFGFYCDEAEQTCRTIKAPATCSAAAEAFYCNTTDGEKCKTVKNAWNDVQVCLAACSTTNPCLGGFACTDGFCMPAVSFTEGDLKSKPGDPCEYDLLWEGLQCASGGNCIGNASGDPCSSHEDCKTGEATDSIAYCGKAEGAAQGRCGFSLCAVNCLPDGTCPTIPGVTETTALYPETISGRCMCGPAPVFAPTGTLAVGAKCTTDRSTKDVGYCLTGLTCVDMPSETETCTADADCQGKGLGPNAYCGNDGKCGYSVCAEPCDSGTCAAGRHYIGSGSSCYCTTPEYGVPVGPQQIGEVCNVIDGPETGFSYCAPGLSCRTFNNSQATPCTGDAQCSEDVWGPNAYCGKDNFCAYALCVRPCAYNACNKHEFKIRDLGTEECLCAPQPYGVALGPGKVGEACNAIGEARDDFKYCRKNLNCYAYDNNGATACDLDTDCPAETWGPNAYCSAKKTCSFALCTEACDIDNECKTSDTYVIPSAATCQCGPEPYGLRLGSLGEACNPGNEPERPDCDAGAQCFYYGGTGSEIKLCLTDTDCPAATWGPNAYCAANGYCAYSLCAVACESGTCPIGTYKVSDAASCLCAPGPDYVNACDPNPCTGEHKTQCTLDGNKQAVCGCDAGYHLGQDGVTCTQDPCDPNPCNAAHKGVCAANEGTPDVTDYTCTCDQGWHLAQDGVTCTQDPCDPNPCDAAHKGVCAANAGTPDLTDYTCSCDENYFLSKDNVTCTQDACDPNLCTVEHKQVCEPNAVTVEDLADFICSCDENYVPDGDTCVPE